MIPNFSFLPLSKNGCQFLCTECVERARYLEITLAVTLRFDWDRLQIILLFQWLFSTIFQTPKNRVMGSLLHVDSRTSHLERSRNATPQNRQKIATIHQYMRPDKPLSTKRQKSIEGGHFCILNTCLR